VQLLIGTNNAGKVIEISEALTGLELDIKTPRDLGIHSNPQESGETFKENAVSKAHHFHSLSGLPTVADDSGIIVEALKNELGIHTRRWGAGPLAGDEEWINYFLERMKREPNKRASFICSLAHIDESGELHLCEGECRGIITETLEAPYLPGLPISACFRPEGFDKVFSALTLEQKNSTSHRGKASLKLREHLIKYSI